MPVGPVRLAANWERFNPTTGGTTNTYVIGAEMKIMPAASIGINYARNDGTNTPEIYNISAVYSLSKTTNLYAAYNHATDGIPSSYSGSNDATANSALAQTGSSNALIVGIQKGF